MDTKKRTVPKLRFPEFTEDWEWRKLGELAEIKDSARIPNAEWRESGVPYIRASDITNEDISGVLFISPDRYEHYKARTGAPSKGDVLFNGGGEIGKTLLYTDSRPIYVQGGAVLYVRTSVSDSLDGQFLKTYFETSQAKSYIDIASAGGTMKHFTLKPSLEMPILFPNIPEQVQIGKYFHNIDNLITLHQRKLDTIKEYKKGMLQKMFPKEGEKVPEIRFPGFTGEWEQRNIGEICNRVTRKNKANESDLPLTISSQDGLIDQRDFFNKAVAAKDMSNYYLLKKGEFAYNKSYSNGYDYGSIKRLNSYEKGCLSTLYICFELTSSIVDSDYLEWYFDTLLWYKDVSQICAEGARNHGLLNVDTKAFFENVAVLLPSDMKEQKAISEFLNHLQYTIILHQRKLDAMKEYKKGLLQQMFV